MKAGLYDNQRTMNREFWQVPVDGSKPFVQSHLGAHYYFVERPLPREFGPEWRRPWGSFPDVPQEDSGTA